MRVALRTILVLGAIAVWPIAATAATGPEGLPTVLCKERQSSPGEGKTTIRGVYSYRPPNCLIHKYHLSRPAFQLYAAIRWKRWSAESAFGKGGIPGTELNYKTGKKSRSLFPVRIELSEPLSVCGHTIFTEIDLQYPQLPDDFGGHSMVDRLPVPGAGPGACDR